MTSAAEFAFDAAYVGDDWIALYPRSDFRRQLDDALDRGAKNDEIRSMAGFSQINAGSIAPIDSAELLGGLRSPSVDGNAWGQLALPDRHGEGSAEKSGSDDGDLLKHDS